MVVMMVVKRVFVGVEIGRMVVRNQPFITYSDFDPFWLILKCVFDGLI